MKFLLACLTAAFAVVVFVSFAIDVRAATILFPSGGGTGWGNIQTGAIPYGQGLGRFATTTQGTPGFVLSWLNGIPSWTATTTFSNGLLWSAGNVTNTLTAGDGLTRTLADIDCDTADTSTFGCLTDTDWDIFNGKQNAISLTTTGSSGAATFDGTTLNIPEYSGSGGTGNVATSTGETRGFLAYWTSTNGTPATLSEVATTTLTATGPLALSQPVVKVGGSNSVLSIDTSGTWTGNAATASALAANGSNCSAGSAAGGVSAAGAAEDCTDYWTEAENTAAGYVATSRTLTVAGTAQQITSSAGAQDLSANRTWTLSLPSHVIFPGNFQATNSTTTNATTTALDIQTRLTFGGVTGTTWAEFCTAITGGAGLCDGTDATGSATWPFTPTTYGGVAVQSTSTPMWFTTGFPSLISTSSFATYASSTQLTNSGSTWLTGLTSALVLAGSDGLLAEYTGIDCTNQFVRDVSAAGTGTCEGVGSADVSGLDISDDTNLAATWPVVLTGDTLSWGGLATSSAIANTEVLYGTAVNTLDSEAAFAYNATADRLTVTYASTTALTAGNIHASGNTLVTVTGSGFNINSDAAITLDAGGSSSILIGPAGGDAGVDINGSGTFRARASTGRYGVFNVASVVTSDKTFTFPNLSGVPALGSFTTGYTSGHVPFGASGLLATSSAFSFDSATNRLTATFASSTASSMTNLNVSGIINAATGILTSVLRIPYAAAPTVATNGDIGIDSTSNQFKYQSNGATRVLGNGNFYPSFTYATSTAWAGTTTIPIGTAFIAETWNQVQCFTDAGTLFVQFTDGTNNMNGGMQASTTVGTYNLTTNNTFTAAEKRYVNVGNPASSPTKISCTVSKSLTAD